MFVFIDESGTLPDPKDKVIVVAAVGTTSPQHIDTIIKQVRKRGKFKKQSGELKFYTVGNKTRKLFLEKVVKEDFVLYVLVVEKVGKSIPDTPENFAMLCWLLLSDVLAINKKIQNIIFDKHFSSEKDTQTFNQILLNHFDKEFLLDHVDSKKDKRVNIADMIAGAVLSYESGKTDEFYKIIVEKIISLKKVHWKEARRKHFE